MLPRRHKNSQRAKKQRTFPGHLAWVRGFACACFKHGDCEGRIEAAHVDYAGGKGASLKVHDKFAVPMCAKHHAEQHRIGVKTFEAKQGVNLLQVANMLAATSPHRFKWQEAPARRHEETDMGAETGL